MLRYTLHSACAEGSAAARQSQASYSTKSSKFGTITLSAVPSIVRELSEQL